jgi:APA family basic amino acid/polyamine antiporter
VTTIWTGILVAVGASFLNITDMIDLTNIGTQFAFILVCAGVLALRVTDPRRPRGFRTPFVWITAPLGIAFSFYFMAGLPWQTWVRFAVWLVIGLAIYIVYGFRRSRLGRETPSPS